MILFTYCFRGAYRYIRLLILVYYYQKLNLTVPQAFARTVKSHKEKTAIIFEDRKWTFQELEEYSNRAANFFLRAGYKPGQCVALFMENRPEYVGLWLGCAKIGLVPALINSNLAGQSLLHSINSACARGLIFGGEFLESKFTLKKHMIVTGQQILCSCDGAQGQLNRCGTICLCKQRERH